jgi:hypothetical protein
MFNKIESNGDLIVLRNACRGQTLAAGDGHSADSGLADRHRLTEGDPASADEGRRVGKRNGHSAGPNLSGVNVMLFETFSPKKSDKKLAILYKDSILRS